MLRIAAGKEDAFRYMQSWLAGSEWLDRVIEASESRALTGRSGETSRRNGYFWRRRVGRARAGCRRGLTGRWFRRAPIG